MAPDPRRAPVPPTRAISSTPPPSPQAKAVGEAPQWVAAPSAKAVAGTPILAAVLAGAVAGGIGGAFTGFAASAVFDGLMKKDEPPAPVAQPSPAPAPPDAGEPVAQGPKDAGVDASGEAEGTAEEERPRRRRAPAPPAWRPPRRDCDGERSECMRACDSAGFSCRASCTCGVCTTDRTWEDCNRECNICREGCERNVEFCERSCEARASACRASQ